MLCASNLKFYSASRIRRQGGISNLFLVKRLNHSAIAATSLKFCRAGNKDEGCGIVFYNINVSAASKHRTYRERSPLISNIVFLNQTFLSTIFT